MVRIVAFQAIGSGSIPDERTHGVLFAFLTRQGTGVNARDLGRVWTAADLEGCSRCNFGESTASYSAQHVE